MKYEMIGQEMELEREKREGQPGTVMKLNQKSRIFLGRRNRNRFIDMFQLFLCYMC